MLLPALNQARAKATAIKCVSNLKQIGVAVSLYCDDNNGIMPSYSYFGSGTSRSLLRFLIGDVKNWTGTSLVTYIKNMSVIECPGLNLSSARDDLAKGVYNDAHYGTRNDDASTPPNFYGENVSSWLTYTNGNWINMKKLRQSSKWLLVADTWSGNAKSQKYSLYLGRAVASNNYLHLAHAGAANVLWGDLHVASMFRGEEVGKENGVLYCNDPRLGNGITF